MRPLLLLACTSSIVSMKIPSTAKTPRTVVESFEASPFKTPPGVLGPLYANCHWQTIVGSEALKTKLTGAQFPRNFKAVTERIQTLDGDSFDVDWVECPSSSKQNLNGIVVILHGLESNSKGPLVTKMTTAFLSKGFSCCLVSFRGCNGEDNNTPGAYHIGFTKDVDQVCGLIRNRYPEKAIYLSGFSLGGNVSLKYLGELGDSATEKGILGAAVTCVPFDPNTSQGKLDTGFNRAVYSMNFLKTLKKKAERQALRFPGTFDIERVRNCTTIGGFDDAYIAPIYGFADKTDYYIQSGSKRFLSRIRVPAIAINAVDDPFIEETTLPTIQDVGPIAPVRLIYHDRGGHCGFYAEQTPDLPKHGWLAEELARAILHIHVNTDINTQSNIKKQVEDDDNDMSITLNDTSVRSASETV